MEIFTEEQSQIRKYLLGASDPGEIELLEARLLTDENFLQEFCIVKDELVDDYVSGSLSDDDTTRFETHFLSNPRRSSKVSLAKALAVRAYQTQESSEGVIAKSAVVQPDETPRTAKSRWQQYWPVAAGLAFMVLAGFVAWKTMQDYAGKSGSGDQERLQLESELARLNNSNSEPSDDSVVEVTLKPYSVRAIGEDRRVFVKEGVLTVLLQLELAGDVYENYEASLQTDESVDLGTVGNVKPTVEDKGRIVRLKLPAKYLKARGYQIKLSGLTRSGSYEGAGLYPFQVLKD
jgi:hypothetical protein